MPPVSQQCRRDEEDEHLISSEARDFIHPILFHTLDSLRPPRGAVIFIPLQKNRVLKAFGKNNVSNTKNTTEAKKSYVDEGKVVDVNMPDFFTSKVCLQNTVVKTM